MLFQTVARVVLTGTVETLAEQVQRRVPAERLPGRRSSPRATRRPRRVEPLPARESIFHNGLGGFTADGREYVISLEPGQSTPAPWANVIASPHIGTVVSEKGGAYTWVENAHEFRLTTFHNDPVSDSSGEAFYLRDDETGAFWSPTPLPSPGRSGYVCRHGFGYSVFEHSESGIVSELSTYVAMDAPVKFVTVKLRNQSGRSRRLSLTGYWELVLGEWRHANLMHIVTEKDPDSGALFARNPYSRTSPGRVVFAQVSEPRRTVTGNRAEFIGRNGSLADPAAMHRARLSGRTGAGLDPCAAIQTEIELADGQEREIVFVVGAADDADEARRLVQRFGGPAGARRALEGGMGALEPRAWGRVSRDSRPRARRARQRLADLPDPLLPVSGAAAATTSRAAPTASAINCRTPWPCSMRPPGSRASICCAAPSASSARATCSTGGILPAGRECGLTRPTTISGCRTRPAGTCRRPATRACSTSRCPSSKAGN